MDNAKSYLINAQKKDGYYLDKKYVKTACGTAYSGLLVALDGLHSPAGVCHRGSIEVGGRALQKEKAGT